MARNDRRPNARRFASPRFARNLSRRVTKNAQCFVYDGYLQIANFHSTTTTSDYNYFIWDPTELVATRPLARFTRRSLGEEGDFSTVQPNFQTFKLSNLQTSLSTVQPFNSSTFFYTHDSNKNMSEIIAVDGSVAAHYRDCIGKTITTEMNGSCITDLFGLDCYCANRICTLKTTFKCIAKKGKSVPIIYVWKVVQSFKTGCRGM